ncbi:MAG: hypothetical protein ABFC18_03505, partial [Rikenellaceae bacterium]
VLPVYNKLIKQCYVRSGRVSGDKDMKVPVITPRHRLPALLWMDGSDGCAAVSSIYLVNDSTNTNITSYFSTLPTIYNATADDYFQYKGDTLKYLLPFGVYYLKITMDNGYVYYSDWIEVTCVYENIIEGWTNFDYNTFTTSGTTITSAIESATGSAYSSNTFQIIKGQSYTFICYATLNSGALPFLQLMYLVGLSNEVQLTAGLNEITFTATGNADTAYMTVTNKTAGNWSITEAILINIYSEKYLTINFSHSCNLGDLLYEDGLEQTLYLETEAMEPTFPYTEKGQENGYGQFVPTWQRQEKNYIIRTLLIPQFIVDVLHRLKLHDTVEIIDLVGDTWTVKSIDVEHDWQFDDKYYALATLTVDLNETIVITACCTAVNECP